MSASNAVWPAMLGFAVHREFFFFGNVARLPNTLCNGSRALIFSMLHCVCAAPSNNDWREGERKSLHNVCRRRSAVDRSLSLLQSRKAPKTSILVFNAFSTLSATWPCADRQNGVYFLAAFDFSFFSILNRVWLEGRRVYSVESTVQTTG